MDFSEKDSELEEIRQRRMQQLMAESGQNQQKDPQRQQQMEEQNRQKEEQRSSLITRIVEAKARERLSNIALVKPEKARGVEDMIVQMATTGQLRQMVSDDMLVQLLSQINQQQSQTKSKITFQRKNQLEDDDDEYA